VSGAVEGPRAVVSDPAALIAAGLAELRLPSSDAQRSALLVLARLLERWAQRINLTAHRSLDSIIRRLILDAAALSTRLPPLASLVDVGSGAGFPGLPIAILRPGCRVTLVEARLRRHHFQRAALRAIGPAHVRLVHGRAEQVEATLHEAGVAQAAAQPALALGWLRRWVAPGGLLLLPGAEHPPQLPELEGVSFLSLERYTVPCGGPARTLWMGRMRE
jgi:16S rRNA (guanine527-N7)-methyltransferase